jgi:hypothetical protein
LLKRDIGTIHKNIYEYIKKKALSYEGKPSASLKRYQEDQVYYNSRNFHNSNSDELINSVTNSHFIYLGDFHTFDQNQRTLLRIMRSLLQNKKKFALGLEMIQIDHQIFVDTYLNDQLTELEFLESIEYHDSWRFPWNHYKLIFDFAKEHGIEILALNSEGSLKQRDRKAAEILSEYHENNPSLPLLVLFGELHIVPNKLPKNIMIELKDPIRHTIIHQNIDEVYWKMSAQNNQNQIVKFSYNEYCIQTSPPWVKYESMVYWFENMMEDPEFDIHEYIIETGLKIFGSNVDDNFLLICDEITKNLDLELDPIELEDFNLYDHSQLEYMEELIEKLKPAKLEKFFAHLLETNQSFKLPDQRDYYCSNYSLNKISYLAGIHIFSIYQKQINQSSLEIYKGKKKENILILLIFEHMYAYFFSKIFNPHRKCDLYIDLKQKLKMKDLPKTELKTITRCLEIIDGKSIVDAANEIKQKEYVLLAKYLGQYIGDYFYNYVNNPINRITRDSLERDFLSLNVSEKSYQHIFKKVVPMGMHRMHKKRFF